MKNNCRYLKLNEIERETLIMGVNIIPTLNLDIVNPAQKEIHKELCKSCKNKLKKKFGNFNENEMHLLASAAIIMQEITKNEWDVAAEIKEKCTERIFVINKLADAFKENVLNYMLPQ